MEVKNIIFTLILYTIRIGCNGSVMLDFMQFITKFQ